MSKQQEAKVWQLLSHGNTTSRWRARRLATKLGQREYFYKEICIRAERNRAAMDCAFSIQNYKAYFELLDKVVFWKKTISYFT